MASSGLSAPSTWVLDRHENGSSLYSGGWGRYWGIEPQITGHTTPYPKISVFPFRYKEEYTIISNSWRPGFSRGSILTPHLSNAVYFSVFSIYLLITADFYPFQRFASPGSVEPKPTLKIPSAGSPLRCPEWNQTLFLLTDAQILEMYVG